MKTFPIKTGTGMVDAEQLATFAHYVQGGQFRFVVTRLHPHLPIMVTHRASTKAVCEVTPMGMMSANYDYAAAGRAALAKLIARVGEARVRSVLSSAEKPPAQLSKSATL